MAVHAATGSAMKSGLEPTFRGKLIAPDDAGYDEARSVWNGMIDKRPALIARCTGVADVIAAVNYAREHDLLLAVRGGGHNVAGSALCDGGLVIDLSQMRGIRVDPDARVAHVQAGAHWADLDHETQQFGLATPGGMVSTTGVAGLTLGGGFGYLSRKFGMACDNLLSVDIVTADGRFLTASATENPDLFWAIRGGGGNFGVVTSFTFQLHRVGPTVMAGMIVYPIEDARGVLRFFREYADDIPDELGTLVVLLIAPPAPFLPEEIHGKPAIAIAGCYAGPVDEGEYVLQDLRAFGRPVADLFVPMRYENFQAMFDAAAPAGLHQYWKSEYIAELEDGLIDTYIDYGAQLSSPLSHLFISHLGGSISSVNDTATAAANRNARYLLHITSTWRDPSESATHIEWTRSLAEAVRPYATGGSYLNFLDADEAADRSRTAYGANYERLVEVKNRYDPENLFRMNTNIRPTAGIDAESTTVS